MEIGKSFTYAFEDNEWISKLGLGGLITLVPILNFAWVGYTVETMKNVAAGAPRPLPNWTDLGKKFMDGLLLSIAMLIYSLPGILLILLPIAITVVPALFNNNSNLSNALTTAMTGVTCVLGCFLLLYFLAVSFLYPAVMLHFADKGTFGACFEIKDIFALVSSRFSDYLTAWAVWIGASFVISIAVGMVSSIIGLIPCLGQLVGIVLGLFMGVYITTIEAHLFGQFAGRQAFPQ